MAKAEELQSAADRHDMKAFYAGLKAVYGPLETGSASVRSLDGSFVTDPTKILARWVEHFQSVLNQKSEFDSDVLSEIPQWPTATRLAHSDFLFDCYMRYTNTLMYVCMYVPT